MNNLDRKLIARIVREEFRLEKTTTTTFLSAVPGRVVGNAVS
jgi:hypothetical protein